MFCLLSHIYLHLSLYVLQFAYTPAIFCKLASTFLTGTFAHVQAIQQLEQLRQAEAAIRKAEEAKIQAQYDGAEALAKGRKEAAAIVQEAEAKAARMVSDSAEQAKQAAQVAQEQVADPLHFGQ